MTNPVPGPYLVGNNVTYTCTYGDSNLTNIIINQCIDLETWQIPNPMCPGNAKKHYLNIYAMQTNKLLC